MTSMQAMSSVLIAVADSDLDKEIDDDPEHACCSCERLHKRKSVMRVKYSDNLGSTVWPAFKAFIVEQNPGANEQVLYMCNYCKPLVKKDEMPPRCVLSGLQTISTGKIVSVGNSATFISFMLLLVQKVTFDFVKDAPLVSVEHCYSSLF